MCAPPKKNGVVNLFYYIISIYLYRYIVCANFFGQLEIPGFSGFKLIEINVAMGWNFQVG